MGNRLRSLFESVVYAGMKPGAPAAGAGWWDRLFSGSDASDPLYLTNQTFDQKARRAARLAIPLVLLIALTFAAIGIFAPRHPKAVKEATMAEVAAKTLPAFNKEMKLDSNQDIEVTEVRCEHTGGNLIAGSFRNRTSHPLSEVVVVFDLADASRSQLGGVTVIEKNVEPGAARNFSLPVEQTNAMFAVVREVRTRP